ncbi:hypothetical protein UFOVP1492_31 [uncultured Caudovirales phage]|uniref:Rho termination factor, N-terminal n=1 Tax=uncultured Caudovirales phage TaxID=2100421 RepID=A0A6J5SPQ7_9CAUD|nr:hypothetical protein UFOVP1127_103 [uncultured Caudovirales phage]CAB4193579.1 hypothetical protein UFOVP1242_107 [uncultured Caudovirales phage]CAB4217448.1 hypothetical protein UFOVP1492_31 [uncultured Caudovirales phage]CAB5231329.1 hypothetical protein UFOVP1580_60 [uncultured Caudovirales phage]
MSNVTSQLKTYTRKELNKMKIGQLDAIAEEVGIESLVDIGSNTPTKVQLVDAIIARQDADEQKRLLEKAEAILTSPKINDSIMFRELSPEETLEFKKWARSNPRSTVSVPELVHPVVREEWAIMALPSVEELKIEELEALAQDLNMPDDMWEALESYDEDTKKLYIIQFVKSTVPMAEELETPAPAAETPVEETTAPSVTLNDLKEADVWAYAVSPKVKYTCVRLYNDEKERPHVVVTDKANKEMDLFGAKTLGNGIIIDEKA